MKKNYMQPSVVEWRAEFTPLMLGSITVNDSDYAEVVLDDTEVYDGVFSSRGHSDVWEDEAEDDEQ